MKLFILLLLFSSNAFAWKVESSKFFTNQSQVTIEAVDNVKNRCEEESKKRNLGGFGYSMEACSFWKNDSGVEVCLVILKKTSTPDDLAHEIYHCFAGQWH